MYLIFLMILIIMILFIFNIVYKENTELFKSNNIDYYVISIPNKDRLNNIEKQTNIINNNINNNNINNIIIQKIDAVIGIDTDLNDLVKKNIL
jgi:hypothetical protein